MTAGKSNLLTPLPAEPESLNVDFDHCRDRAYDLRTASQDKVSVQVASLLLSQMLLHTDRPGSLDTLLADGVALILINHHCPGLPRA